MGQRGQRSRGHTERRTLVKYYATGRKAGPAFLVRGSSRRITTMTAGTARSANIRVINRRRSHLDRCLGCPHQHAVPRSTQREAGCR